MLGWLVAASAGLLAALLLYGTRDSSLLRRWSGVAALRMLAVALLCAAVLNAPLGHESAPPPVVLLDVSQSWIRGGDSSRWLAARAEAIRVARDSTVVFGDSVRTEAPPPLPGDVRSQLRGAVLTAAATGRSVMVFSDGEVEEGGAALASLPAGSRVVVPEPLRRPDVAIASLAVPRFLTVGDSVSIRVSLAGGSAGSGAGELTVIGAGRIMTTATFDSLPPYGEHLLALNAVWQSTDSGPQLLTAALSSASDSEPRNDTLHAAVHVSTAPGVVFVSTSPDQDSRFALDVLRGTLALPVRSFLRVAPGNWRLEGPLTRVTQDEVLRALTEAPVVILHGDTALFGAPRERTSGSLILHPSAAATGEWYPSGTPASPISGRLAGIVWDSLAPVGVTGGTASQDGWNAIEMKLNRAGESRFAIAGTETPRRVAVVGATGVWRWAFRGGVQRDAFSAIWGSLFDWAAEERMDRRAAVPAAQYFREGESVQWRRGTATDSTVTVTIRRRDTESVGVVQLRFAGTEVVAESPPLPAGVYDVETEGGSAILVINSSSEMVPMRPSVSSTVLDGVAVVGELRGARRTPLVYVLALLALCAEWLLRRRLGLR